jgi:hypothetical protein
MNPAKTAESIAEMKRKMNEAKNLVNEPHNKSEESLIGKENPTLPTLAPLAAMQRVMDDALKGLNEVKESRDVAEKMLEAATKAKDDPKIALGIFSEVFAKMGTTGKKKTDTGTPAGKNPRATRKPAGGKSKGATGSTAKQSTATGES